MTVVGLTVFIMIWSLVYDLPGPAYFYLQVTANLFMAPTLIAVVGGLYWRRSSAAGAILAFVLGALASLAYLVPSLKVDVATAGNLSWALAVAGFVAGRSSPRGRSPSRENRRIAHELGPALDGRVRRRLRGLQPDLAPDRRARGRARSASCSRRSRRSAGAGLPDVNGGSMSYVLRFVQRFQAKDEAAFMALEAQFAALERRKGWPRGRRSRPLAGREPGNTLVWESELPTLAAVNEAMAAMAEDSGHAHLLKRQIPFFLEAWTEVYEVLDLPARSRARAAEGLVSDHVDPRRLLEWCRVPADELVGHPGLRVPFRMVEDARRRWAGSWRRSSSTSWPRATPRAGRPGSSSPAGRAAGTRRGPSWSTRAACPSRRLTVFHMDECLDWQGRPLPKNHPYNFRTFMERHFYGGIRPEPATCRRSSASGCCPRRSSACATAIAEEPVDLTLGGWGQDGHVAYNQARRHPSSHLRLEDLAASTIRVQENNVDTILALAQRTFGGRLPVRAADVGDARHEGVPLRRKVRVFSDTGSWKQTALRVALFSEPTPEYPMTLLQRHADALVTATRETARHPISENPEWELL